MSDFEEEQPSVIMPKTKFMREFHQPLPEPSSQQHHHPRPKTPKFPNELEASVEGPINPVNYSGTQINIWGVTPPDLAALVDSTRNGPSNQHASLGPMTEDMINVCRQREWNF
jgi:hypothetical protein